MSSSLSENYQTGLDIGASKSGVTQVPHWTYSYNKIVISRKVFQSDSGMDCRGSSEMIIIKGWLVSQ